MNMKEVKDLIHEILQSDISEFELEHTGTKIRLRRGLSTDSSAAAHVPVVVTKPAEASVPTVRPIAAPALSASQEAAEETGLHFITSPIVGTFYRAPTPGADPFVKIGDMVDEGTVLCIVEAMKLLNEIPSDIAGEVAQIYVDNAHPVEFGQKLFAVRSRK